MAASTQPLELEAQHWLTDAALRRCTAATRGIWIDLICTMHANGTGELEGTTGEFARMTGKTSKFGHYYDLVCDALVNIFLFLGIGIGLMQTSLQGFALPMGCIAGISVAAIFSEEQRSGINTGPIAGPGMGER